MLAFAPLLLLLRLCYSLVVVQRRGSRLEKASQKGSSSPVMGGHGMGSLPAVFAQPSS